MNVTILLAHFVILFGLWTGCWPVRLTTAQETWDWTTATSGDNGRWQLRWLCSKQADCASAKTKQQTPSRKSLGWLITYNSFLKVSKDWWWNSTTVEGCRSLNTSTSWINACVGLLHYEPRRILIKHPYQSIHVATLTSINKLVSTLAPKF